MPKLSSTNTSSPFPFFALTLLWSWLFWIPAALLDQSTIQTFLLAIGGIGPALSAIVLTYRTRGREGRSNYWRRIIDPKLISGKWYAVIFLTVPLVAGVAGLLDVLLGGVGMEPEALAYFVGKPSSVIPFMAFILLFGPVPEEIGWRGYALDRLQARWSAVESSIILGLIWALWHLPLFFIEGSYQHQIGFGTAGFWLFMGDLLLISVVMTFIYNNTSRSTLSAILFHFMINFVGELIELSWDAKMYQFLVWLGIVLIIFPFHKADVMKI